MSFYQSCNVHTFGSDYKECCMSCKKEVFTPVYNLPHGFDVMKKTAQIL